MRTTILLAMLLVLTPATAVVVDTILEEVDVSRSPLNHITVTLEGVGDELIDTLLKPGVLDRACAQLAPAHTRACTYDVTGNRVTLRFTTVEPLLTVARSYSLQELRPTLKFSYTPRGFLLVDEAEEVGERTVTYTLPTTGLATSHLTRKERVGLEFPLQCQDGTEDCIINGQLLTDLDQYYAGDIAAFFFGGEVEFAVWGVFSTDGQPLGRPRTCFSCESFLLEFDPVGMGCEEYDGGQCPATPVVIHTLFQLKDSDDLINATAEVIVRPRLFPVTLVVGDGAGRVTDTFLLGETMVVGAFAGAGMSSCAVELLYEGNVVNAQYGLPSCLFVPLTLSTMSEEGEYVVRVTMFNPLGLPATANTIVHFLKPGRSVPLPVTLEQPSYMVGEDVRMWVDTPGERCEVALINYTGAEERILLRRTYPCGKIAFTLPETVPPGHYQLRLTAFRGSESGVHTVPLEVEPWVPTGLRGTDYDRLCREGSLGTGGITIRCMGPGGRCVPSSDRHPVCACFTEDGRLADVCEHGQQCTATGCAGGGEEPPFVVAVENGERVARVGLQRIPALLPWELCPSHCLCTDEEASFGHVCGPGEICREDGCSSEGLSVHVEDVRPEALDMDTLATGEVIVSLDLSVRLQGSPISRGISADSITLVVGDLSLPPENVEVAWRDEVWRFRARLPPHLAGTLSPGSVPLFLTLVHDGEWGATRSSIPLWYGTMTAGYEVTVRSLEPRTVPLEETQHGAFLHAYVSVVDARDGSPVTTLTRDDVRVSVQGTEARVFSMRYVPALRQWVLTLVISSPQSAGRATVDVSVARLGRTGSGADHITLVAPGETRLSIEEVRPGSREEPIYQVLQAWGFDMDVLVSVTGRDIVPAARTVRAYLGGSVRESLYVTSAPGGYLVHLEPFRFCDKALEGWEELTVSVITERSGVLFEHNATRAVYFARNPGSWVLPRQCIPA
ncbi:MAG: hypothetical protein QGG50_08050 [Methanopyri archaeon]|nr:hypothetical protein [Methanopyri archaeon]